MLLSACVRVCAYVRSRVHVCVCVFPNSMKLPYALKEQVYSLKNCIHHLISISGWPYPAESLPLPVVINDIFIWTNCNQYTQPVLIDRRKTLSLTNHQLWHIKAVAYKVHLAPRAHQFVWHHHPPGDKIFSAIIMTCKK